MSLQHGQGALRPAGFHPPLRELDSGAGIAQIDSQGLGIGHFGMVGPTAPGFGCSDPRPMLAGFVHPDRFSEGMERRFKVVLRNKFQPTLEVPSGGICSLNAGAFGELSGSRLGSR